MQHLGLKMFHVNCSEVIFPITTVKNLLQTSTFLSAINLCLFNVANAWSRSFVNSFVSSSFSCIAVSRTRNSANAFSRKQQVLCGLRSSQLLHRRLDVILQAVA